MTRKISYELDIGYAGCTEEGEIEVGDDLTDAQIDTMVDDMAREWATSWEGDERLCWDSEMSPEEYEEATEQFYENVSGSWSFVE